MNQKLFCPSCAKHTYHVALVDAYAHKCMICGNLNERIKQIETESNVFITPNGDTATVVRNDADQAIFSVEQGSDAGYYFYDKRTGFGGIQKR